MNESKLKEKIQQWVRSQGGFSIKISDRFTIGIPDMWVCIDGRGVWLELKAVRGKVSPLQVWHMTMIEHAGGEAYEIRRLEDVIEIYSRKRDR